MNKQTKPIWGTTIFGPEEAMKGYALNKMCYSFNHAKNRKAFLADEESYYDRYNLTDEQRKVVKNRDILGMLEAGGNIYYLAKLAGILKLDVQDVGALQTGMTKEAFIQKLSAQGEA